MPTQIQWRRGTTAQTSSFTGAVAEVTVDTDKKTLVVHDGVTPGGYALAKEASQQDAFAFNTANAAFAKANNESGVNATQNTNITTAQNTATAAFIRANNSLNANTGGAISGNVIPTTDNTYYLGSQTNRWHTLYVGPGSIDLGGLVLSNQNGTLAVSVGGQPPTQISGSDQFARNTANAAFASANNIDGINTTQNTNITIAQNTAQAAFNAANNVAPQIEPAFTTANGAFAKANNEAGVNVTQNTNITNAQNSATAAFIRANNSLNANNGGTITGDLSISGNLSVLGNTFTVSATTIVANDTVILLGAGNYTSDLLDIGISAHYNDGVNAHTGFIRDHGTKEWQLFEGYTGEIGANNDVNINDPSFKRATLNANLKSQLITLNNQNLQTYVDNAYAKANNEAGVNLTQNTNITTAQNTGDAAFAKANNEAGVNATQNNSITAAFVTANSAGVYANGAFAKANTDFTNINITSNTYGNATYIPIITVSSNGRINTITTIASAGGSGGGLEQVFLLMGA